MKSLVEMNCVRTRKGDPTLTKGEIEELKPQVPNWQIENKSGLDQITRTYKFKNFSQALDFTNKVGAIAEEQDHHPMIVTEWGKVTATWWTHSVGGLHLNDFIMAAKTDHEFEAMN